MYRRRFIKQAAGFAAAFGLPAILPSRVFGRNGTTPTGDKIVMGCIGVGGMGTGHVRSF